ncbi:MAG TPA: class I SAM-dependent methyltransferase [Acidimicrobiales bacterium]|nr:class I SAM-dependent methyltransferase [Acidimicrobiales bacterium]
MPRTFEEAWSLADAVEGWLTPAQGRRLYDAARHVPRGQAVVEVGSHRGKSTILLAAGLPDGVVLTAIDPFDDPRWGGGAASLEVFEENLAKAGVEDRVQLRRELSGDVAAVWAGPPVGLAWIDGAHDRTSVLTDIDGWDAHLADDGVLLLHDAFSAVGTTEAVLQRLWWSRRYRYVGCVRTLVEFKKEPRTPWQALLDAASLSRRLGFFARMVAIKLARRRGMSGLERRLMRESNEPLI